jgi:hypothetical protein
MIMQSGLWKFRRQTDFNILIVIYHKQICLVLNPLADGSQPFILSSGKNSAAGF